MWDAPTLVAFSGCLLVAVVAIMMTVAVMGPGGRRLFWLVSPALAGAMSVVITLLPEFVSMEPRPEVAATFVLLAHGLAWQAVRSLFDRAPNHSLILLPGAAWLAWFGFVQPDASLALSTCMQALVLALYNGLIALEFSRVGGEGRRSGLVLFWIFAAFGALALLRLPLMTVLPAPLGAEPAEPWAVGVLALVFLVQCLFGSVYIVFFLNERASDRNRELACRDPMTGALNRRAFSELWERIDAHAGETSVLLFDIDHFKRTNDQFGHDVGDRVIGLVVSAVRNILGTSFDQVYRMGGEEFACVLQKTDRHTAMGIADRIRVAFRSSACLVDDLPVNSTMSIGVAATVPGETTLWQALKRADQALYRAKETGRDRVCDHDGDTSSSDRPGSVARNGRRTDRAARPHRGSLAASRATLSLSRPLGRTAPPDAASPLHDPLQRRVRKFLLTDTHRRCHPRCAHSRSRSACRPCSRSRRR
jgi:diguanylate cyclase (GGDEF)-like protein